jgi:hypothetical protein
LATLLYLLCLMLSPLTLVAVLVILQGSDALLGFPTGGMRGVAPLMVLFGSLACVAYGLLIYSGVLFNRAAAAREGRGPRTVAAVCALLLCTMVAALIVFLMGRPGY